MAKKCNCNIAEETHEHCIECDTVLDWNESENLCIWCEERIKKETMGDFYMKNLKISEIEQFNDLSKLVELTDNASAHREERFLIGFQVEMNVTVINKKGDKKDFHLVFQNEERNNQLQCYSNYGMSAFNDCDAGETPFLDEWLSETEEYEFAQSVISRCESIADDLAEAKYLSMLEEFEEEA